ncbi:MAG TPA: hypothetical protein VMW55_04855 [Nitrosopumilaceae archaeon]|nr:hypothetical protein [Nitrosopumilaceae archaeon]
MNNEIGRKITSLTIMTIMIAGGLTVAAPGVMPVAHAANANLFVSAENSQFDNYMSGPQVIEVVVIDSDINDTDDAKGEPDVTVNGKDLRMIQAVDGNWYGYFADRDMAQIADSTATTPGTGLDFGNFCDNTSDLSLAGLPPVFVTDTEGIAIGNPSAGSIALGSSTGGPITGASCGPGHPTGDTQNVLRENKQVNTVIPGLGTGGQIGVDNLVWPFIQLYELNPTGNVVVQYNKGGGAQTTTLTFDTVEAFAGAELDKSSYGQGDQVHATITDLWLNIDPTDEDSWTFGTTGTSTKSAATTNYQVFDENGNSVGNVASNTGPANLLTGQLPNLMCEDNCVLLTTADSQGSGNVITLADNNDSVLTNADGDPGAAVPDGINPQNPLDWQTASTGGVAPFFMLGTVPVTITEQGPNSGVFGSYDESDTSSIVITNTAARGTSATIDYNETPVSILVAFAFGSIDIQLVDDEWSSGEEVPVILVDADANLNSRADEDLDFNNPNVALIPTLQTGSPVTLASLTAVTFSSAPGSQLGCGLAQGNSCVQAFSQRAMLTSSGATTTGGIGGDTLTLAQGTMAGFFNAAPVNDPSFKGVALYNYDFRSMGDQLGATSVNSITIGGVTVLPGNAGASLQGLILIDNTIGAPTVFGGLAPSTPLTVVVVLNGAAGTVIGPGNVLPIASDIFGFGFTDDGVESGERVANQIIRLELEETGDNTSTFEGSLEYTMLNQLNILNPATYTGLSTIANDPNFIVMEDLTDEDSPRVNYLDLGADGVSTQVSDQQEAPSHSGVVSFDLDSYKTADTVNITLEDADLNVDSDLIDIFTVVPGALFAEPARDAVGAAGFPVFSFGPLGRLLDVTLDDQPWQLSKTCTVPAGVDTGLGASGFSLIEQGDTDSGLFKGDFQIPVQWCRPGALTPETATGLDLEVNYVDFRDASGEIIEVGDSAGIRANTGSVSLDRTVYPVPFGVPGNFGTLTGQTSPDNKSIFPIHATGIATDGSSTDADDLTVAGSFLPGGDLTIHVRVNDPDFDISASGEDILNQNTAAAPIGPVKISVIRGSEVVILGFAGGPAATDGTINVGTQLIGDGKVANGEIDILSSTLGFGASIASGNPSAFTNGPVSIVQLGIPSVGATFTDNAANGIDSGTELSAFTGAGLISFTNGLITISQGSNTVAALFTDSGSLGLGAGAEISQINSFLLGAVQICQPSNSGSVCATGTFTNLGTGMIAEGELNIQTSIDQVLPLPTTVTLDDTGAGSIVGSGSATVQATATWTDINGDLNVDDGELTIVNPGTTYATGELLEVLVGGVQIATATFTDLTTTLENGELTIFPSPSGSGFVNGPCTITPSPVVGGVTATCTFTDAPTVRQFGPILEIAPDAGIFESDIAIRYTDGPESSICPTTVAFSPLDGTSGTAELNRFSTTSSSGESYCILQGDILQVEYTDPADASGDINTVTDSATFDLRNGVLQSDKSVYIIGSDIILTMIEPDLDLDNDAAETYDLDLIEWDSDAATVSMGNADGEGASFDPEPTSFRETGDSTGIFQIIIEVPEVLAGDRLERGEEIVLEYTDWGPSGSDFVGDEDEDVNLTIYTSNFGATVELDQKVYTWTDKVYVTIVAPDHNFDSDLVDEIGNTDLDPIKVASRGDDIDNYKLVETGTDTGIFTGEVILTGFTHDADGDSRTGDDNGNDVISRAPSGNGPTDGLLPADDDDGITVSFEFSEDETVVGSALVRWNIGETQWLEASYPASGTGVVRVIDPDMNLDPEAVDNFDVDVWSDSDAGGIDLTVTETNEATGIFEGTVFFTVRDESSGHRLRVAEGDTVTAEYEDNTLPNPYTTADELDITATSLIGTVVPPLERAPASNCRVVDAFGNTLSSVSVDQQVQITCDVSNGQDREQPFAYLIQIQDANGVTVSLAWITGSLSPGQSFSPALSWIPENAGNFDVTAFVWESVDNPTALSPPVDTSITVI